MAEFDSVRKKLSEAEKLVAAAEREVARLEGQREQVSARLKDEFGADSEDEAKELVASLREKREAAAQKVREAEAALDEILALKTERSGTCA
jgi:predicted transcriptional regulator